MIATLRNLVPLAGLLTLLAVVVTVATGPVAPDRAEVERDVLLTLGLAPNNVCGEDGKAHRDGCLLCTTPATPAIAAPALPGCVFALVAVVAPLDPALGHPAAPHNGFNARAPPPPFPFT